MTTTDDNQPLQQAAHLVSTGRYDEAEAIANQVLTKNPKQAQAHYVLGLVAYMRKKYPQAIEAFNKAAKLTPGNPVIFSNLGESLRRSGEPKKALAAFKRCVSIHPGFNMGMMGIANCLSDLKRNDEAMKVFQRLLAGNPSFAPAYHYLGAHLARNEQYKQALPLLRKAVALRENYADALMTLASTLENLDQVDETVTIYEKLLEQNPDNIGVLLNLGNIRKTQGKSIEADQLFERVLELDPENLAVQYSISHSKSGKDVDDVEMMEQRFDDPDLSDDQRRALHFTVGKYYDDQGDSGRAFDHFKQGNDMDDRIPPYEAEKFSKGVDRIIEVFSEKLFKARYGMGAESEVPVFIVGMPRSGTSLTEQTLASHPQVFGAGELKNIGEIQRILQKRTQGKMAFPESIRALDPVAACSLGERYLKEIETLAGSKEFARITDKMPGNTSNLGLIALLLPRAKIIHCMRNPMDSCFSCYSRNFGSVISYTRKLEDLGQHYSDYRRLMDHWHKVLPIEIFDLRYEDMVADHEGMSRKLLDFCGLEWNDACLEFQKTERRVKTASTMQVRQPIYSTSVAKWRQYEAQLQPLFSALGKWAPRVEDGIDVYL